MARTDRGKHDWFQIKAGLRWHVNTLEIARQCEVSSDEAFIGLYEAASWFRTVGKYGVIVGDPAIIDMHCRIRGLGIAMLSVGWLRTHGNNMTLAGFTNVSAIRKSIGAKLRAKILSEGKCRLCEATGRLVIDHIIPVAKGGHSDESNLQPLCVPCNIRKGHK